MSKDNINLPKTAFSMKANLPTKEPDLIEFWNKINLYQKLREDSKGKEKRTGRFEGRRALKKGDGAETEIRTDQRELKEVINKGQTAEEEKLQR